MTRAADQKKIDALWGLVYTGVSYEDARKILSDEDYALFEKVYVEFDIMIARQEAKRTTSVNYVIDVTHTAYKRFIHGKRYLRSSHPGRILGRAKWYFDN